MNPEYCEHWNVTRFGSNRHGLMELEIQCGLPAVGTLNGILVCEKHESEWRKSHGMESE